MGCDVMLYVLKRVVEFTGGASLKANIALVMNNVKIGVDIVCELVRLWLL